MALNHEEKYKRLNVEILFYLFIYTIFWEGDTISLFAILPCGPL